ncbi:MAG: sugar nucleotide-binding protein, partial [Methanobacterium sp.]|nr:sugar nucleotide-binding protein [Methanobacterium sp.]
KLLIEKPAYGIYHLTNSDSCSWYEYAQEIFKIKGVEVEVKPVPTTEFPRPAPRPEYSVLDNYHWKMGGFKPLRSYKDALKEYLSLL